MIPLSALYYLHAWPGCPLLSRVMCMCCIRAICIVDMCMEKLNEGSNGQLENMVEACGVHCMHPHTPMTVIWGLLHGE
jgi:hypothetical protein